ncbi:MULTISPECIES: gas vesicle protein GvpG [Streptomyces]|uniref:Gas vesicle protein n=1 Tax=Streptomyces lycii TaxID=2654337 RepID=A0ABQ7FDP4_9ACTN|nr:MULTISPECIES: gas vesicle protein GvpG [Streptomyces]KAF4407176.1 gas vesicle protein [Streptomyces lycii]PGH51133.1 gas vesicle protein [Streptomyces sp. Ru87]
MGLLSEVLLLPLAPVRGAGWVVRQVVSEAERQYYDPSAIQRELGELAEQLDQGLIDETEFDRREDELLDRLEAAQQRRAAAPGGAPSRPYDNGRP